VVPCSVQCLLHMPDQQRVVCGCEDGTIRLHTLDGCLPPVPASSSGAAPRDVGGGLLPTVWTGRHHRLKAAEALTFSVHKACMRCLYDHQLTLLACRL